MEQVNELIKKIETLSEQEMELKSMTAFSKNLEGLKKLFEQIQQKSKETQDYINNLDVGQIVESSMDYLADEFYDKFVPPMKFLDKLVDKTKKLEGKKKDLAKELENLRLQLRQRIIDAQNIFSDTIGKTPYSLETMESLTTMRQKLIPKLESQTDELNKNVEGISDEINTELANNYKSLLDSLNKLKNEIRVAEEEVERLASTSAWIKEQLAQREKELAEKDAEAEKIKAELSERESELQKVKEDLQKELEERELESKKIQDEIRKREEELEALKTESTLSKAELTKRQKALEAQIAKTREELDAKASESEQIKQQLKAREDELTGKIAETQKELIAKTTDVEASKEQLQKQLDEKNKELEAARAELAKKEAELKQMESKVKEGIEEEAKKLKSELNEILQFLEKSPKYQLLYLINNEEEITLSKIQEVFKFDPAVVKTLLEDLNQKNLISVKKKDDDLLVKIEQKLNPISYLEIGNIFDNKFFIELNKLSDISKVNKFFDDTIVQINKYKVTNKQEAGFLLSLLYLYIYKSKNYELFNKIRTIYNELKPHSFYLRLIENALTYDQWESKKPAILENLMPTPKLNIMNKKFEDISESDESYPKNGPFSVKKYKPLTLLGWEKETNLKQSNLNKHSTVLELAKWVWLNGKGSSFKIELTNSKNKSFEIIVSSSKKVDAHLIIKENELVAS
ncbi:MAG: hypothetical protein ACTSRG_15255 [Candidatus Helarchaeota archaeon]